MNDQGTALQDLMKRTLPETGFLIKGSGLFMEVMDPTTQQVWMSAQPVTQAEFDKWTPPPPFQKVGCASASMDRAAFRHDPADDSSYVQTKVIDGHDCIHVAIPGAPVPPTEMGMPLKIMVTKGHTLGFKAGRRVKFMNIGDHHFVETVGGSEVDAALKLPPGATFSELSLPSPWAVELPNPTTTYFWFSDLGMRSFQGPVTLPDF